MACVQREILVKASPDNAWDAVRDFGAVHRRLTPGVAVDARLEGEGRVVTLANGVVLHELLVDRDDVARRLAYASVGGKATHHNSSLQVFSDGNGGSRIVWTTDVLPHELKAFVSAMTEQGALAMQQALELDAGEP
jgi:hypothetical protein